MDANKFIEQFGTAPEMLFQAPARVNLIGEHIDYNGGHVLPCAIGLYTKAYVRKRKDTKICLYSENTKLRVDAELNSLAYDKKLGWANYPLGIYYTLMERGFKFEYGLDIHYWSNIPLASGLSSSASILDLTCYILNNIYSLGMTNEEIALLAVDSENGYNGLNVGIMDEYSIALGKKDSCIFLNTATREYEYAPFNLGKYSLVILKTNKPRILTESKYNERVKECQKALSVLKPIYNINNLCELREEELSNIERILNDDVLFRRTRHCITEENRVIKFISELKAGNIIEAGKILDESHMSLKNDYEVTGENLDVITASARKVAVGSRMTGAGFSGCAIAIVETTKLDELREVVTRDYKAACGIDGEVVTADVVDGPSRLDL